MSSSSSTTAPEPSSSSAATLPPPPTTTGDAKPAKPNAKQAEKEAKKAARLAEEAAKAQAKADLLLKYADIFGNSPIVQSTTYHSRNYVSLASLAERAGQTVLLRARVSNTRKKGNKLAFLVLRDGLASVQAVAMADNEGDATTTATTVPPSSSSVPLPIPKEMIQYIGQIPAESIVDVEGEVRPTEQPIVSTSVQNVELQVLKIHTISESLRTLPYTLEDASRGEHDEDGPKVNFDTRLNARWLDLRTPATQAVFRLQSCVCEYFRAFLLDQDFVEIHVPKIVNTASEGGANVFKLQYFQRFAYLAQSPQLHKQITIQGDLPRVFEIGPVFRAENSNTHRHLTEFVGLDVEMRLTEHYYEVLDMAEGLFHFMFTRLSKCEKELEAVRRQYPFEPLVWKMTPERMDALGVGIIESDDSADGEANTTKKKPSTDTYGALVHNMESRMLRLHYPSCIALLNTALKEDEALLPTDDINTTNEKLLGKLVKERYGVDFFISDRFPSTVRPFYTMPCPDDPLYTNSYDMFIRGEEISSGAQRIHDSEMLLQRAASLSVDLKPIMEYVDSFKLGAWPHGGFGAGLERVVMLFLGLGNIRLTSLYPRDPQRLAP